MTFLSDLRLEPARTLFALLGIIYSLRLATDAVLALRRRWHHDVTKAGRIGRYP